MPENTFIYDTVWEEFREELQLTYDEMCEAIMFNEDRSFFNDTATTEIYTILFVGSVRCV